MHKMHIASMATSITIRNVPDEVRNELAARAALSRQSLQEHLLSQLIELAQRPSAEAMVARLRERKASTESKLSAAKILRYRDEDKR